LVVQSPATKNQKNLNRGNAENGDAAEQRIRIDNLIVLGESAPPEVAADLFLTLASSSLIPDRERKIQLIEQAFRRAVQAREPVPRRSWSRMVDTRSGFKQEAYDLKLDKLSLESDAVTKMIRLDRVRARTMFESIEVPAIKPLTCADSLGFDFDFYYQTMLAVAEECFSADEKKAGAHMIFLADRLEGLKSLPQLNSAMKMLFNAKESAEELSLLVNVLTKVVGQLPTDARAFAFAMDRDTFVTGSYRFIERMRDRGVSTKDFINAFRSLLVKEMSGEVCADVSWLAHGRLTLPSQIEGMNREFSKPIVVDDIRPSTIGAKATDTVYWTTPRATDLMRLAQQLRFGETETILSREERETEEWRRKLLDFLGLLADWGPDSEPSAEDYFQERCNMYGVLVDLCPDDSQGDLVLRAYANYLKERSAEYKGRIEWILPVKDYLRRLRSKSDTVRRASLDPWLTSSDTNLQIYGELELLTTSSKK
jgi:hypothetical protein